MGIKNVVKRVGDKAGNRVAKLAALSSGQVEEIQLQREKYLLEKPDPSDELAIDTTWRMMAADSIEIYHAYLPQIKELYLPVKKDAEYDKPFSVEHNIRYFNITKWVQDKKENSLEKLVNVYAVLANEECNIALVFNRTKNQTNVYLAVVNTANADNNVDINSYKNRLIEAIRGNFPGAEWQDEGMGIIPCLKNERPYSVATASNIPTEKSDKFVSQTIEKLLDGIIPEDRKKEYTIVLLATPIKDVEERKLKIGEIYSGMVPYASWQTNYTYTENNSIGSSATVGVNVGASAGIQSGQSNSIMDSTANAKNESITNTESDTDSLSRSESISNSQSSSRSEGTSETKTAGVGESVSLEGGVGITGIVSANANQALSENISKAIGKTASDTLTKGISNTISDNVAKTTGTAVANTLGKAVTKAMAATSGITRGTSLGANFGANFARSSSVTAMIGKNEGITQTFTNFNIKHALELLENQIKRMEQSTALGMWDFAAYVLSEDFDVANNVAHSYLALTLGEESYMSQSAINVWKGMVEGERESAREIANYIRELRHPVFGLNKQVTMEDRAFNVYPSIVTATTGLSGKELAYSLNFPQKSIAGLPVLECAEFGRNVVTYDGIERDTDKIEIGSVFHMRHVENQRIALAKKSLASHTFVTGSTGSGKSNTVYQLLNKVRKRKVRFLVIEPAKGEYKHIFGADRDVSVYGTNPSLTPLLRINPFSFPKGVHVLEHLDRLVEIFNVCWPMYAAMPAVLKSAVEKSYTDCGWDLVHSVNEFGELIYPTFADVAKNIKIIIDTSEFDTDNKGAYKGSLLTRLESLTNGINGMIFVCDEISDEELFDKNVIVDLSRVGSSETKSLIMGMLVLKLQEYRMTSDMINAELRHITVLEEAHNLLKRTSADQTSESSNLVGKSVEMLANAIAEMRTYGEGFIIADQAPGLLDMSVIRNTNTKIIMRLPDQGDRELVGRAAGLNEEQIVELAKLPCGVAAIYQNEWVQPVLGKVDKYEGNGKKYIYFSQEELDTTTEDKKISESLLDCIMEKELFGKEDKKYVFQLKEKVIKSKLSTKIKKDFMKYLLGNEDNEKELLGVLIYDLLKAEPAIKAAQQCNDISNWVHMVVNHLTPSIKKYSGQQIDLAMELILSVQSSLRDTNYRTVFSRFTEEYEDKGRVY
jgi:DNA helicase HerA-like ATPase